MGAPERPEHEQARLDRQLSELLQELRIAMPGVQLLFAFLLAVPFQARFGEVSDFARDVYLATLLCATLSSALLIAPAAYHRLLFQRGDKRRIIRFAERAAISGLFFLAVAMTGSVLLVTDFLFGTPTTVVVGVATVAIFAWFWFGVAGVRRRAQQR
ncbi:MAG: hypothetical protein J7513_12265 [Solirubrobacteraceae bacterium]|nr:hypothetical protein [Solirubrobacteraceae bacterium]